MGKFIGAYVKSPIIKKWYAESLRNLNQVYNCQSFPSIQVLLKSLYPKSEAELCKFTLFLEIEGDLSLEHLKQILDLSKCVKVIGLGYPKEINHIKKLLTQGVRGYLDVTFSDLDILDAIRTVHEDRYYLPPSMINEMIQTFIADLSENKKEDILAEKSSRSSLVQYSLSEKERVVVEYLLKGYSYKQIAEILGVSSFAINQRTKSLYKKCGVKSRNELSYLLLK